MSTTDLTPGLLDLMEHEKVIEQGLATFVDVGLALLQIRDGKKYRHAGYATFQTYCRQRWGFGRQYGYRLIKAAQLSLSPDGDKPASEGEARRIIAERHKPATRNHPAPYSDPILNRIATRVTGLGRVVDPFAGSGRVHELRERASVTETIGIEIEPEWAAEHPDTIQGNALNLTNELEPESADAIVTSPTYGNRMADHHNATDDSTRQTYKHTLGHDLHTDNSGQLQWGDAYRSFHLKAWTEAAAVLKPGGVFVVNIKDHIRAGTKQDVVAWHIDALCRQLGLECIGHDIVWSKGLSSGAGQHGSTRDLGEVVLTFRKPQ